MVAILIAFIILGSFLLNVTDRHPAVGATLEVSHD